MANTHQKSGTITGDNAVHKIRRLQDIPGHRNMEAVMALALLCLQSLRSKMMAMKTMENFYKQ
eukprot:10561357-Karenia_brevis.AAC.1